MSERAKLPVLRLSQKELTRLYEKGDLQIVKTKPEMYTRWFQDVWEGRQQKLRKLGTDIHFSVPICPYTQEEILALEKEKRRVGYLPKELSTQETRYLMELLWPEMKNFSCAKDNRVTNDTVRYDWFDYEIKTNAPNRLQTVYQLQNIANKEQRFGMNINEYIIASQDSKLFTRRYLDEYHTWSRLIGSYFEGYIIYAAFTASGHLRISSSVPEFSDKDVGGRLVGFPKV